MDSPTEMKNLSVLRDSHYLFCSINDRGWIFLWETQIQKEHTFPISQVWYLKCIHFIHYSIYKHTNAKSTEYKLWYMIKTSGCHWTVFFFMWTSINVACINLNVSPESGGSFPFLTTRTDLNAWTAITSFYFLQILFHENNLHYPSSSQSH